jgi:hypothetical protein
MTKEEELILGFVESVYNQVVREAKIDVSNLQAGQKHQLDNWLNKR